VEVLGKTVEKKNGQANFIRIKFGKGYFMFIVNPFPYELLSAEAW
jgi:hypothetical protein